MDRTESGVGGGAAGLLNAPWSNLQQTVHLLEIQLLRLYQNIERS